MPFSSVTEDFWRQNGIGVYSQVLYLESKRRLVQLSWCAVYKRQFESLGEILDFPVLCRRKSDDSVTS